MRTTWDKFVFRACLCVCSLDETTHTVGQVLDQILDLEIPDLELAVEPGRVCLSTRLSCFLPLDLMVRSYHFPNVFSCTLTQLCSRTAMSPPSRDHEVRRASFQSWRIVEVRGDDGDLTGSCGGGAPLRLQYGIEQKRQIASDECVCYLYISRL